MLVEYDAASDRLTFHMQSQGVFGMRNGLAATLGEEDEDDDERLFGAR